MPLLHWLDRDKTLRIANTVPFRLLEEDNTLSYGDSSNNMIIQGDNLEALKTLLPYYKGQVKCIYIDPPYNTKSAFEHYDDNLEHSQWLHTIYPRLELLRDFLREDGSIWVSIDDNESHYLKVIMDEIFGRKNFLSNIIWQKMYTVKNSAKHFSEMHDHIITYAKNKDLWTRNDLPRSAKANNLYSNPDNDPRGPWMTNAIQARNYYSLGSYAIKTPDGRTLYPPNGTYWRISEKTFDDLKADGRIWWGANGDAVPRIKKFLAEMQGGMVPATMWLHTDVGTNAESKVELRTLFPDIDDLFITPKPEKLISRVLEIASNKGDLVLDSFLGSGTTAAVANKMGRRYIGIEMGEHAVTHVVPRLQKVIDGEQGGISKAVNWQGGGGFRFYRLGELVFDENGQLNHDVKFSTLTAHIWFTETKRPYTGQADSPLIGVHEGTAYYLLYNGILGDRRPDSGNVLTNKILDIIPPFDGPKLIYGEASRLGEARLHQLNIIFKQTPYDIKVR